MIGRYVFVTLVLLLGGIVTAWAVSLTETVTITASVEDALPTIESPQSSSGGSNSLAVIPKAMITFSGVAYPNATVVVSQIGGATVVVKTDASGAFRGSLLVATSNTSQLVFSPYDEDGSLGTPQYLTLTTPKDYVITLKDVILNSSVSRDGTIDTIDESTGDAQPVPGDCNVDTEINDKDFLVLQYWYGQRQFPACVDLNNDGAVTLQDFALLAYRWKPQ